MMGRKTMLLLAVSLPIVACGDQRPRELVAPTEDASLLTADQFEVVDLDAVEVEWSDVPLPTGEELVQQLTLTNGEATVSLKHPQAAALGQITRRAPARGGRTVTWSRKEAVNTAALRGGLQYLESHGVEIHDYMPNVGIAIVKLDPGTAPELLGSPFVEYIKPHFPHTGKMDAEQGHWSLDTIRAPITWSIADGSGAKVLLIDGDGYNRGHPDLPLVPLLNCGGPFGACAASSYSPHMTQVLGTLAMIKGNGAGGTGVAHGLAPADVYLWTACGDTINNQYACDDVLAAAGIDQGISWGVDVINVSLAFYVLDTQDLAQAVARAEAADIVIAASAGNTNAEIIQYPAQFETVLGVAGVSMDGSAPGTGCGGASSFGPHVSLSAPFVTYTTKRDASYGISCGTSFSSPMVAAGAALLREVNPDLSAAEIRAVLTSTAADRGTSGWDKYYGAGILDVAAAVATQVPLEATILGLGAIYEQAQYQWSADVQGGLPPFSYEWRIDGALASTSPTYSRTVTSEDNPGFTLSLRVTDSLGSEDYGARQVTVYIADPGCDPRQVICDPM